MIKINLKHRKVDRVKDLPQHLSHINKLEH